jgi:hypothetical protein
MASSRVSTALAWSASASVSVSSGSNATSDAFAFNIEDWDADLQINADNAGTPASGDTLDCYILWSAGDVLGDSGDDYDTVEHAEFLCRLDTYATNTPGEDPARKSVQIRTASKGFKLYTVNNSGGRSITVRAMVSTHRPQ